MLDHISFVVSDLAVSRAFYDKALAPLGISLLMEFPGALGYGKDGKPSFWLGDRPATYWTGAHKTGSAPMHIALIAPDRAAVRAFYEAAMAAGAQDFGAPGPRPQYHAGYYGAFVLDPDGNNIEAVCHRPE